MEKFVDVVSYVWYLFYLIAHFSKFKSSYWSLSVFGLLSLLLCVNKMLGAGYDARHSTRGLLLCTCLLSAGEYVNKL